MNKIIIVILVILLVMGAMVGFLFYSHFSSSKNNEIKNKVSAEITERQIKEETELFVIDIKYPLAKGFKDINKKIDILIQKEIDDFKSNIDDSEQIEDFANGLYITYDVSLNTPLIMSIIFDVSVYFSGAAHPVSYTRVFNYDLENSEVIENIFAGSYLETISDYCIEELIKKIKPDEFMEQWIYSGAGPTEDNYKYIALGGDGLIAIFDQYQVAAYALGKQFVEIPYNEIKDLLTPEIISLLKI